MSDNPTIQNRRQPPFEPAKWHEKETLPDGKNVAKLGALWFICNEDWTAISQGYHEIRVREDDYIGKLGAREERVNLTRRI